MGVLNLIYIIDDEEIDIFIARQLIRQVNPAVQIDSFLSAESALWTLQQAIAAKQALPDLLFIDINMPLCDGWQFLNKYDLFRQAHLQNSVVYLLSSSVHCIDYSKAENHPLVAGMLTKPFSVNMMRQIRDEHF